jgi:hypothetical protein
MSSQLRGWFRDMDGWNPGCLSIRMCRVHGSDFRRMAPKTVIGMGDMAKPFGLVLVAVPVHEWKH